MFPDMGATRNDVDLGALSFMLGSLLPLSEKVLKRDKPLSIEEVKTSYLL